MIGVEPGRRARSAQSRQTGCGRHVAEPAGSVLFIQNQSGASEEQQIGAAVVVIVAGHDARSRGRGRAEPGAGHFGEAAAIVPVDMQAAAAAVDKIEVAVAIEIGQRHRGGRLGIGAGRIPRGDAAAAGQRDGRVGIGHVRHAFVHQLRLGAGRSDRLRVAPLLEIGLRVGGRVFRRAQPLKLLHRGTPARGVAGSNHRGRQTVRCRGVVRLGRHRGAKRVERLGILPLFEVQLSKVHGRAGIGRIHPLHP